MRPVVAPVALSSWSANAWFSTPFCLASRPMGPSGSVHTPVATGPGATVIARTP
jgi:hypothetical protein